MNDKQVNSQAQLLQLKADELVDLLKTEVIDAKSIEAIQQKLNNACDNARIGKAIPNDFERLLSGHQLHQQSPLKRFDFENIKKYLLVIIGVVMITLGMAMIIMPAPPYFEMFTIFHFNANDGVTLMDLIALVIVFTGVYLPLSALSKKAF